ncbi:MAG: hypothetical protein AB1671_03115 [Thermodesulfobacteriota bacterium]|jgi:hypothetical protein
MHTDLYLAYSSSSYVNDLPLRDLWTVDELILPEQFHDTPTNVYEGRPEVTLMRAVLEDAINCFRNQFYTKGRRQQRLAREAEEWFFSDESRWPFSFLHICSVLGLDPQYIRMGLKRWYHTRPARLHRGKRRVAAHRLLKIAA